jgi:hypothetical protein
MSEAEKVMAKTLEQRVDRIEQFLTEAQNEYDSPDKLLMWGNLRDTIADVVRCRFYVSTTSTLEDEDQTA